jgi:predicted phosphodiesterase
VKIVHLTDIHVQTAPELREMTAKRMLGTANLYVLGRRSKFSETAQRAAVQATVDEAPDAVIFTGDLTAQALDAEFSQARAILDPILTRFPTIMIPGNHDTYVRENTPGDRMRELFGPWMGDPAPSAVVLGDVACAVVETCRNHPMSTGYTPPDQLEPLAGILDSHADRFVFLCMHYPLVDRNGDPYDKWAHRLSNAPAVRAHLSQMSGIGAILHGHVHHGYRTTLETADGPVPVLNPGSSGYACIPETDRTAHLNIYEITDGRLAEVRRLTFDGETFTPEAGGAYATGR